MSSEDPIPTVHQSSRSSSPMVDPKHKKFQSVSEVQSNVDNKNDHDSTCSEQTNLDSGYEKTNDSISDCDENTDQHAVSGPASEVVNTQADNAEENLPSDDIVAEADDGDSMSMEVNLGDGSSRRASDLSTLSGLQIDNDGSAAVSRSDSCDSLDKEIVHSSYNDETLTWGEKNINTSGNESQVTDETCQNDNDSAINESEPVITTVAKRNSAEIRNNIPEVNQVKDYANDITEDTKRLNAKQSGAIPKSKKQSPGVARRIATEDYYGRDTSSSERETDDSFKNAKRRERTPVLPSLEEKIMKNVLSLTGEDKKETDSLSNDVRTQVNSTNGVEGHALQTQSQPGSRYIGARLAFTESDSRSFSTDSDCIGSGTNSLQSSPDKPVSSNSLQQLSLQEFEATLTEIPLNDVVSENVQLPTLSPEHSDVEDNEVDSVISDRGGDGCGQNAMPSVMDGLSDSREGSDIEEFLATPEGKEIQRQVAEEQNQRHTENVSRRLEVRTAMADIKSAIEKSKSTKLKESNYQDPTSEPIWVMRDSYVNKLKQQEEMKIVREQKEQRHEEEYRKKEQDKVYEIEAEDYNALVQQFSRHDGTMHKTPRGFDSDSDSYEEEHDKSIAGSWFRKKYTPVHTEADDQQYLRKKLHGNHNQSQSSHASKSVASNGARSVNQEKVESYTTRSGDNLSSRNSYDHSVRSAYSEHDTHASSKACNVNDTAGSFGANGTQQDNDQESSSEYDSQKEEDTAPSAYLQKKDGDYDTDDETDQLLDKQYKTEARVHIPELQESPINRAAQKRRSKAKEVAVYDPDEPSVLIEGVLFRARYLGSTQLVSEGQPSKAMRMLQAQEAVGRIKAPEGESQPSTEVDLFVSTEKIMVLNTDLQEIMMDHALRTISYIADIEDIVVIMARRRTVTTTTETGTQKRHTKIICHVFETDEAQLIAQSIGQAFQVAYMEFLKANGIEDPGFLKDVNYEDVLNQQQMFGEELTLFSSKEAEKEVIVPKIKGEALGVVIVESGWGSMVPTVVLANMSPTGAAARCGQLNIGDQIMAVNGVSLVGLPLSSCQNQIKTIKNLSVAKLTVVSCPPVIEVLIKRPDTKYQLGFSVQNGVICSLLRGGIAERGGVRVGHRIIEINSQSVVAVPHEKIVSLLANSVGEIAMKTMPTSIYRLLTGQETPHYI